MRLTRRTLLFRTSAGAAAIGALAAAPRLLGSQPSAAAATIAAASSTQGTATATTRSASEPVMAYIRDASQGEIALYAGTKEVILRDPELVSRILQSM